MTMITGSKCDRPVVRFARLALLLLAVAAPGAATPALPSAGLLPDRQLSCSVARATNVDPSRDQSLAELTFDSARPLSFHLPAIPAHDGPPPDPSDPPAPVDPRTRITDDPTGLMTDAAQGFGRVVDLWPQRVEMMAPINARSANGMPLMRVVILSDYDAAKGSARLFLATAADAGSLDVTSIYHGVCRVALGAGDKGA